MAGAKEGPFKTAPYPLTYLAGNIYRFYNKPSPQYKIRSKNVINNYKLVKQKGYFNSDIIDICPRGGRGFYKRYIPYYRFPKVIINNKGTQFTSTVWAIIYKILRMKRRLSLIYHPETDGTTERVN